MINYFNLSFNDLLTAFTYILSGKSFMRINHDMFLRNLSLQGNIANIGAGHNYKNFSIYIFIIIYIADILKINIISQRYII